MELLEELDTLRQKVAHLAIKYERAYPDLLQDYTLAMLLYLREYEAVSPGESLTGLIDGAIKGDLVNFTSLHRAITATKRDFQTPEQRRRALILEEDWTEAFRVDWQEAP